MTIGAYTIFPHFRHCRNIKIHPERFAFITVHIHGNHFKPVTRIETAHIIRKPCIDI